MKQCVNCGSENLMTSNKESSFIPGAKYAVCKSCGNVMFLLNDTLIATPTNDTPRTKLLIQDATDCFDETGRGIAASLDGKTMPVDIQPIQTIESIQEYIAQQLLAINNEDDDEFEEDEDDYEEEEEYEEYIEEEFDCDKDCDACIEGCPDFEDRKTEALLNGTPIYEETKTVKAAVDMQDPIETIQVTEVKRHNYLILLSSGEKQLYMNTSKDFMLNIINDIGMKDRSFRLFELNEINVKPIYHFI